MAGITLKSAWNWKARSSTGQEEEAWAVPEYYCGFISSKGEGAKIARIMPFLQPSLS